jgi:hypothetical protein
MRERWNFSSPRAAFGLHRPDDGIIIIQFDNNNKIKIKIILSSSRTMTLGSTETLAEMNTMNFSGGKRRPAPKADNLTAICEPIV